MNKYNFSLIKYEIDCLKIQIYFRLIFQHIFRMEMMEYDSEGIMAETLTFTDNQPLLVKTNKFRIFK